MRARRTLLVCCGLALAGAACGTILDLQPPPPAQSPGADAATDSTMSGVDTGSTADSFAMDSSMGVDSEVDGGESDGGEAGVSCPPLDAALPDGAIPDGATGATTAYRTMNQVVVNGAGDLSYQFHDTTPLGLKANNYGGGTFDGRYVYFAPANSGIVTRFDTTKPFNGATAFSAFDTTTLDPQAEAFGGAVFDGRYVYFVPRLGASLSYPGLVVRYDTKGTFGSAAAWSVFDTENLGGPDAGPRGFQGSVFDGRYVYLVPRTDGITTVSRIARYDTQGDAGMLEAGADAGAAQFGGPSLWSVFDLTTQDMSALGYIGGVFDGRYVYLVPYDNGSGHAIAARYDTTASFTTAGSWQDIDLATVDPRGLQFAGGAFDGRYVYLVPYDRGLAVRYDTTKNFTKAQGWNSKFYLYSIVKPLDAGVADFTGAAFDGRFVYYIPSNHAQLVRYDTLSTDCWQVFDLSTIEPGTSTGFTGAIYDGRFLYLAPRGSIIVRFDTKTSNWMPNLPEFHGSFY